jgi:putative addiction module CopG family antidote
LADNGGMGNTFNVALSPQLAEFVREKVDSGLYATASEVVREALRWFQAAGADPRQPPTLLELQEQAIDRERARAAVDRLRELRAHATLGPGLRPADLRDEGRR